MNTPDLTAALRGDCGHRQHVGPCPSCQRRQLARSFQQLLEADRAAAAWTPPPNPEHRWRNRRV